MKRAEEAFELAKKKLGKTSEIGVNSAIGLPNGFFGKLMNGTRAKADSATRDKIEAALGISAKWLFDNSGPMMLEDQHAPAQGSRVVLDDRYPERAEAVALLRDLLHPAVITAVETISRKEVSTWSREDWIREIKRLDRERKRFEAGEQADPIGGEDFDPSILDLPIQAKLAPRSASGVTFSDRDTPSQTWPKRSMMSGPWTTNGQI